MPRRAFTMVVLAGCAAACSPIVREAPFPARPDTVAPGDLLGPYDGQVLDAETGQPVAGAIVAASWGFTRGVGLRGPAGGVRHDTRTDADGRFAVPALGDLPEGLPAGLSSAVSSFTLVVYKPGYQGYRSDRVATVHGARPRRDFAQRGSRIELRRFGPEDRRARHLAYLGLWSARGALRDAPESEIAAAVAEAARPPEEPVTRLDASRLLTIDDVRTATGYAGGFEARKLRDPPTTDVSDSHHLRAVDRPERFDAAIRAWRLGARAEEQYQKLLRTYPGAIARDEVLDRSFRAAEGEILAIGMVDRSRGLALALTCGAGLCPDHDVVLRLAARVVAHLPEMDPELPGR